MSFERVFVVTKSLSGAAFAVMMGAGVASACEPSGWIPAAMPSLSCLGRTAVDGGFDIHNDCSDPVEIIPAECGELCSEAILVASNTTVFLALPAAAKDGDRQVFDYKRSEQTGTLEFTYDQNDCSSSEESGGGCSTASTGGRSAVHPLAVLLGLLAVVVSRNRRL
jgi:MYXO-CTERM domain-containing protein